MATACGPRSPRPRQTREEARQRHGACGRKTAPRGAEEPQPTQSRDSGPTPKRGGRPPRC
eukprot:3013343-Alexandrium_andersonii.AAC.1